MKRAENLLGRQFGHLTVVKESDYKGRKSGAAHWICRCGCGNYILCRADNLKSGHTTQCSDCSHVGGAMSVFVKEVVDV